MGSIADAEKATETEEVAEDNNAEVASEPDQEEAENA